MAAKTETARNDADWQFNKSVIECNRHMLENRIATDVTFLVSDESTDSEAETISAHKYMLMSRSPVFYSMLCGELAEKGEITVTDIHPQAFRQMLSYIYLDDLELSLDLVPHVINASKKYLLPGLTTKCTQYIKHHLGGKNVCTILNRILIFDDTDLNEFCLNLIMKETKQVMESKAFLSISRNTLSKILDIETCQVKELDLFKACLKWARQKCDEEKKEATGINIRELLGDCITKFRFSNLMDFAKEVCRTEVLTKDEEHGIICHLSDKRAFTVPVGFSCETRLRPIYSVITSEEIQPKDCQKLDFNISIYSYKNNAINVNTLLIGEASSPSHNTMYSIKYNDKSVSSTSRIAQGNMIQFQLNSPLIIKPGSSAVQIIITLYQKKQNKMGIYVPSVTGGPVYGKHRSHMNLPPPPAVAAVNMVNVYGVPKSNITLQDGDRISLKMSDSDNKLMPLLGLTYQLVLD